MAVPALTPTGSTLEELVASVYSRDYMMFGFDAWSSDGKEAD